MSMSLPSSSGAKHSLKMRCAMGAVFGSGSSLVLEVGPSFTLTLTYP